MITVAVLLSESQVRALIGVLEIQRLDFVAAHTRATLARDVAAARIIAATIGKISDLIAQYQAGLDQAIATFAIEGARASATAGTN